MHRNRPIVLVCVQKYEGDQKHGEQCRRPANYALSRVELSQSPRGGFEIHAGLLIFILFPTLILYLIPTEYHMLWLA